jgi:hypothetical protein
MVVVYQLVPMLDIHLIYQNIELSDYKADFKSNPSLESCMVSCLIL